MKIQPILFLLLLIGTLACSSDNSKSTTDSTKTTTAKTAEPKVDGSKIYKTYCVTCHGLYGDMGNVGAFDLTKTTLTLEEKIQVITKGRNTMTPYEGLLSPKQITAVAEFTETLKQ